MYVFYQYNMLICFSPIQMSL